MFRRFHAFEFCDQYWVKGIIREAFMDCLEAIYRAYGPYKKHFPSLISEARSRGTIVDLATGNAAPVISFLEFLKKENQSESIENLKVIATDLHPHLQTWADLEKKYPYFSFRGTAFDAVNQAENIPCVYTMFSAFHHFNEDDAIRIISSKLSENSDLIIFEMTPRDHSTNYIWLPFSIPFLMLSSLFSKKIKLSKILLSIILPIVPLMVVFDGLISNLRTYTKSELENMAEKASRKSGKTIKVEFIAKRYALLMHSYSCRFFIEK